VFSITITNTCGVPTAGEIDGVDKGDRDGGVVEVGDVDAVAS
jgi:hypothetical protein